MVNTGRFRAETSLFTVHQAVDVFFDAFQDYFDYFYEGREQADTPPLATFNTDTLFGILTIILRLFPLSEYGIGFPRFLEEVADLQLHGWVTL